MAYSRRMVCRLTASFCGHRPKLEQPTHLFEMGVIPQGLMQIKSCMQVKAPDDLRMPWSNDRRPWFGQDEEGRHL